MERLAERGTIFRDAYCPSPLCLPSQSAFMSGRRMHQIQTYSNCSACLDKSIRCYGAVLDRAWVQTIHAAGKSHVWDDPENLVEALPHRAAEPEEELRRICSPGDENETAERFIRRQLDAVSS